MPTEHAIQTLILHGGLVFFVGMACGVPYALVRIAGNEPEREANWRIAHMQNLQNGMLLLIAGACATYLSLSPAATALMVGCLVAGAYLDMTAWFIRPITGHSGLLPVLPPTNLAVCALFGLTVILQFLGIAIFIVGAWGGWPDAAAPA